MNPLSPAVFSLLGLFLLLIAGCLDAPEDKTPSSSGTDRVRKISKTASPVTDLATGLDGPTGLALDSFGNLFFTEANAGTIKTVPKEGGEIITLVDNLTRPYDIVLDEGEGFEVLYLVEFDAQNGRVEKVCVDCPFGKFGDLESLATGQKGPISLTQDTNNLYYTNREGQEVWRISKNVESPQQPALLAQFPDISGPQDIVLVNSTLYFTDADASGANGALKCVPAAGGTVTTIVDGLNEPGPLETDGTGLYLAEAGAGMIRKVPATCEPNGDTVLASGLQEAAGIAVDETHVYFTERGAGKIGKVPKNGPASEAEVVEEGLDHPFRLILDDGFIYFTETETSF